MYTNNVGGRGERAADGPSRAEVNQSRMRGGTAVLSGPLACLLACSSVLDSVIAAAGPDCMQKLKYRVSRTERERERGRVSE